jgi:hypothetical protein
MLRNNLFCVTLHIQTSESVCNSPEPQATIGGALKQKVKFQPHDWLQPELAIYLTRSS